MSDRRIDEVARELARLRDYLVQQQAHFSDSPEDAAAMGFAAGEVVRVTSRRGTVDVPLRLAEGLRPGLTCMTLHFQDDVATNLLTIDATDPKSGTAEFKATAIRIQAVADVG